LVECAQSMHVRALDAHRMSSTSHVHDASDGMRADRGAHNSHAGQRRSRRETRGGCRNAADGCDRCVTCAGTRSLTHSHAPRRPFAPLHPPHPLGSSPHTLHIVVHIEFVMKKNTKTSRRLKDTNAQKRRKKRLTHFAGKSQPMEFCHKVNNTHDDERRRRDKQRRTTDEGERSSGL
jgi:hypothetical protein